MRVQARRPDGSAFPPGQPLTVVGIDSWLSGPLFAATRDPGHEVVSGLAPTVREVVEDWLRGRGPIAADRYRVDTHARLRLDTPLEACTGP